MGVKIGDTVQVKWVERFEKENISRWNGYKTFKIKKVLEKSVLVSCTKNTNQDAKDNFVRMAVTLAFSLTFDKCQGCNMERVVVVLGKKNARLFGNIQLPKIYVSNSRVTMRKHLAKIQFTDKELEHLTKLSYPPYINKWRNNYTKDGKWKKNGINVSDIVEILQSISNEMPCQLLKRDVCVDIYKRLGKTYSGVKLKTMRNYIQLWYDIVKGTDYADVDNDYEEVNNKYI